MGSWRRGVQHEVLVAVGEREGVAVDGDLSDDRVPERLGEHRRRLHVMPLPEPGELGAAVAELLDEAVTAGSAGYRARVARSSMTTCCRNSAASEIPYSAASALSA